MSNKHVLCECRKDDHIQKVRAELGTVSMQKANEVRNVAKESCALK